MSLTALAMSNTQTWPFVTFTDFDLWINQGSIGATSVSMVVLTEDRKAWSIYSKSHIDKWIPEGENSDLITPSVWKLLSQGQDYGESFSIPSAMILTAGNVVEDDTKGSAAIGWQSTTTPFDPRAVNYNYMGSPRLKSAIDQLIDTRSPVSWTAGEVPESAFFLQPITSSADQSLVAFLFAGLPWTAFVNTLFEDSGESSSLKTGGVSCVIHDQCNSHSIALDLYGEYREARLLEKDEFEQIQTASIMMISERLIPNESGTDIDECSTPFLIEIYLTEALSNETETPKPVIFAGAFVAMLCALLFLLYDIMVKRRQARLANAAEKSLAIVNSLFPETV